MNSSIYTIPVTRDIIGLEYLMMIKKPKVEAAGFGSQAFVYSSLVFAFQNKELKISLDVQTVLGEEEYKKLNIQTIYDFTSEVKEQIENQFILQVLNPLTKAWMEYKLTTFKDEPK